MYIHIHIDNMYIILYIYYTPSNTSHPSLIFINFQAWPGQFYIWVQVSELTCHVMWLLINDLMGI